MKKFFSYDGLFLRILSKTGELIMLDVVFILCCLPVVTIGPAMISLYYTIVKVIRRESGTLFKEFFSSMKRVMLKGIVYTLVIGLWAAILTFAKDYAKVNQITALSSVSDIMILLSIAMLAYLFPVLSRFSVSTGKTLLMTFAMCMRYFYFTLIIAGGTFAMGYVILNAYIPAPCILCVPAFWCFICSFMIEPALLAYMPPRQEDETAWYYPPIDPEKEAAKEEKARLRAKEREEATKLRNERRLQERLKKSDRRRKEV